MTLGEFIDENKANGNEVNVFAMAYPDKCSTPGIERHLLHLNGNLNEQGQWEWDGTGVPGATLGGSPINQITATAH